MKPLSIANVVRVLNASLGEPAAMRLAETCGGKRIDIPKAVGGVLLAALGEDITTVLVDHYAGCALDVPSWGHIERMNRTVRLRHDVVHSSLTANDISDDRLGVFKPMFQQMGHLAAQHPEERVFGILRDGFLNKCYDGEFFFDTDHPTLDVAGAPATYSNMQAGAGPAWFLLDTSQGIKPLVWQEREPYTFETVDQGEDIHVFSNDEFLFGIRARVNAGDGLPQLAFGSKAALTPANYAAARAAMMGFRSDQGRILGIRPTALVVPPALESDALSLLNTEIAVGGASSNPWKGTASLVITPFVA